MSLRLGEVLVQKGWIGPHQLKQALDAQVIYGGHLGTCLVEMGLLDVDALAAVLGERFEINPAQREMIENIHPDTLAALTPKLVERHRAIPFDLEPRVLRVAMVDPCNLVALDELSFASGHPVEAWIAPELLVVRAMERYYDIPRKLRHVPLSGGTGRPQPSAAERAAPPAAAQQAATLRAELQRLERRLATTVPGPPGDPREGFIPQSLPRVYTAAARVARASRDGAPFPVGGAPSLPLEWIKYRQGEAQRWCELYRVNLEHPHFDDLDGVLVIWQEGQHPVLRVCQGPIRDRLIRARRDPELIAAARLGPLYASWARVPEGYRDGVERYLVDMLNPSFVLRMPPADPVQVNLPR